MSSDGPLSRELPGRHAAALPAGRAALLEHRPHAVAIRASRTAAASPPTPAPTTAILIGPERGPGARTRTHREAAGERDMGAAATKPR